MQKFNIEDFDVQLRQDNKFGEIERVKEDIIDKTIYNWQNKFSLDEKENILKIINHLDFIYEGRYFSFLNYLNRLISDNLIGNTTIEKLMDYHYAFLLNKNKNKNYFDNLLKIINKKSFIEKSTHKIYFSSIFKIEIDDFSSSNLFNVDLSAFGTLLLKFNNVDINYVTEFADFNLEKATVKFYPDLGIIEGTNGKIYSDNNLSYLTNINFNLSSFSIDLGKGIILSKEAYLNAKEQKNVKGIFEFIPPKSSPSSLNTFKFTSSTSDIIILSDKQIKITGGIEIEGDKLLTRSQNDESSNLSINLPKGKKINLRSKSFDLSGTKIKSLDTYFVFYDEKDSLYHPSLEFLFDFQTKKIEVLNLKGALKSTPFYSSYFKVEIYADFLNYTLNENSILMGMIIAPHQRPLSVFSMNYFSNRVLNELSDLNGINILKAVYTYFSRIKRKDFYIGDIADYFKTKVGLIEGGILSLWRNGFVSYDRDRGLIEVLPKIRHYFMSHIKKSDFDEYTFNSLSPNSNNLKYDILNKEMLFEGVDKITLSKKNNIVLYPKLGKSILKKNRELKLLGNISVGSFDFRGVDLLFNYDEYKLDLIEIDTLKMLSKKNEIDSYNYLFNIGGNLFINHPKNKSSKRSLPKFPSFISDKSTNIYFDLPDEYGEEYDSSFYFAINQFRIDSLDKSSLPKFEFPGTFYSNKIFKPIETKLVTMPDNSFGFDLLLDEEGLAAYDNKVNIYNRVLMDSTGLYSVGSFKYNTTMVFSNKTRLFPDSIIGYSEKAFMYSGKSLGKDFEYPDMELENFNYHYSNIKKDYLKFNYDSLSAPLFTAFDNKVLIYGNLNISSDSVFSDGKLDINNSTFLSNKFNFYSGAINSKYTDVELNHRGYDSPILISSNVSLFYDIKNKIYDIDNDFYGDFSLPYFHAKTSLNSVKWSVTENTIEFSNRENASAMSSVQSINKKFLDWSFPVEKANIDLNEKVLTLNGVNELQISDAYIIPNLETVSIREDFAIDELLMSELILDTLNEFHKFVDANIKVESKNKFVGKGIYEYINFNEDTFKIPFSEFELRDMEDESGNVKLATFSSGFVDKSNPILMEPGFNFFGNIELFSSNEQLLFKGSIIPSEVEGFNIENAISFNEYFIPGDELTLNISDSDDFLVSSISRNSNYLFFDFFKNPVNKKSLVFFNPFGQLSYDSYNNSYLIETKEKRNQDVYNGNSLLYNPNEKSLSFEGKVDIISNDNNFKVFSSMTAQSNLDSMDIESEALMIIDVNLRKQLINKLALSFIENIEKYGAPIAHDNEQDVLVRLSDLIGNQNVIDFENLILSEYKSLVEADPLLNSMFVFSNSNFSWSQKEKSWYNTSVLNLSNIGLDDINASIDGFIEIKYSDEYKYNFKLFLQPTPELWFFMHYDGNKLNVSSSDFNLNKDLSEITTSSKDKYIPLSTVDEEYILTFINNFRLTYFDITEPYDLKSPSDTFLEDEVFETISDDDDDGF